jgi:hypothetical protein
MLVVGRDLAIAMRKSTKIIAGSLAGAGVLLGVSTSLFYLRYIRTAVLTDLSIPQTQTVSVTYRPAHMYWKVSGVKGSVNENVI